MSVDEVLDAVGARFQQLEHGLWTAGPQPQQSERLDRELWLRYSLLGQQRSVVERIRRRLAQQEQRAAWLTERIQMYIRLADRPNAWRLALELDPIQRSLPHERARLERHEQAYQQQLAEVEQLERRMADARERIG